MQNPSSFTAACMQCFANPETSTYVAEVYKVLQPAVVVSYRALNLFKGACLSVAQCAASHICYPDGSFAAAESKEIAVTGVKVSASDDLHESMSGTVHHICITYTCQHHSDDDTQALC